MHSCTMLCTPLVVWEVVSFGNHVLEALPGTAGLAPYDGGKRWKERNDRRRKQVYLLLSVHAMIQGVATSICYHSWHLSCYWDQT